LLLSSTKNTKTNNSEDKKDFSEKEQLIIGDDEKTKKRARQTLLIKQRPSSYLSFWRAPQFTLLKDIIKLIWYTILKYIYLLSLAGLYFACLTSVNLMNAGYSKSSLFLSNREKRNRNRYRRTNLIFVIKRIETKNE
jgi:hypothetical protein